MERKAIVICSVVGFLGLLSAVLGFAAEAKTLKASQITFIPPSTCIYPSSPALGLGLTAAVVLMVAQIIISVSTGCICCSRGSYQRNCKCKSAVICFVFSWIAFVIAFLQLLSCAALNIQRQENSMYVRNSYCYTLRPGSFSIAAVLSLASVVLGIVHYLALDSAKISNGSWGGVTAAAAPNQGGIAMGQPQFPPPQSFPPPNTGPPVFVHEDTYMRRQFT